MRTKSSKTAGNSRRDAVLMRVRRNKALPRRSHPSRLLHPRKQTSANPTSISLPSKPHPSLQAADGGNENKQSKRSLRKTVIYYNLLWLQIYQLER